MTTILADVSLFVTNMFTQGSALITWMTATGHDIVLIPLVLFVTTFMIGGVRKIIKGV